MINLLSKVSIIDNSGAKEGIMIKRLIPKTSTKNSPATVGHVISISVRKTVPFARKANATNPGGQIIQKKNKVQRKNVYQALIVRTKKKNNIIQKKEYQKFMLNAETKINLEKKINDFGGEYANNIYKFVNNPPLPSEGIRSEGADQGDLLESPYILKESSKKTNLSKSQVLYGGSKKNYLFKNNLNTQKLGGHKISWKDNAVVLIKLIKSEYQPIGTRIKGPICKSLKMQKGCLKIVSISSIN